MYINFMIQENKNIYISYWLLLITFLIILIIIVGGLTRLTDSGLSITRWDLFTGILPPLNLEKWKYTFSLYKQTPEFLLINSSISLKEFQVIYWWEYAHRLLGRIIGITYLAPLIFFSFKFQLNRKKLLNFYLIFVIICFQGFLGWYMVKSGLSERVDVSHYRLSMHLTVAFLILIFVFWNYLVYKNENYSIRKNKLPLNLSLFFVFLVLLQVSIGALVSGLDAGQIYQTWPLMNQSYFPDDSLPSDLLTFNSFSNPSLVQFIHRNLAYLIVLVFLIMFYFIFINKKFIHLRKSVLLIFFALLFQISLGILTILSGAYIVTASLHQIGSIFLVLASIILVYKNNRIN